MQSEDNTPLSSPTSDSKSRLAEEFQASQASRTSNWFVCFLMILNTQEILDSIFKYVMVKNDEENRLAILLGLALANLVLFLVSGSWLIVARRMKKAESLRIHSLFTQVMFLLNWILLNESFADYNSLSMQKSSNLHSIIIILVFATCQAICIVHQFKLCVLLGVEAVYSACRLLTSFFEWNQSVLAGFSLLMISIMLVYFKKRSIRPFPPTSSANTTRIESIQQMMKSSPSALVVLDSKNRIQLTSKRFEENYLYRFAKMLANLQVEQVLIHNSDDQYKKYKEQPLSNDTSSLDPLAKSTSYSPYIVKPVINVELNGAEAPVLEEASEFQEDDVSERQTRKDFDKGELFASFGPAIGLYSNSRNSIANPNQIKARALTTVGPHGLKKSRFRNSLMNKTKPTHALLYNLVNEFFSNTAKERTTKQFGSNFSVEAESLQDFGIEHPLTIHFRGVELEDGKAGLAMFFEEDLHPKIQSLTKKNEEFKSLLLASVSHELRTPLNGVIGILQGAEIIQESQRSVYEEYILPALNSSMLLFFVINDLIDFSLINAGHLQVESSQFCIRETIKDILPIIEHQTKLKKLTFNLEVDDYLPKFITSDSNRINQILLNLVTNAIKFTPSGQISISIKQDPEIWNQIIYTVSDTGIGMTADERKSLLQMLRSLSVNSSKLSEHSVGVGLGLTISQLLACRMGPEGSKGLKIVSEKNTGTSIYFKVQSRKVIKIKLDTANSKKNFPLGTSKTIFNAVAVENAASRNSLSIKKTMMSMMSIPQEGTLVRLPHLDAHSSNVRYIQGESEAAVPVIECNCPKVLVVDDNDYNQIALGKMLESLGVKYDTAYNGLLAIEKVESQQKERAAKLCCDNFLLILMDCNMPIMDGYKATKILKEKIAKKEIAEIPIIACTSFCKESEIIKCQECGMDGFVSKPVLRPKLSELLKEFHVS